MTKDPAMPESLEEMPFPQNGLSLVKEFESQPPGTTPVGINVRAYEPLTQRNRGGARPGLIEYINSTVSGISTKIQHLNIIVDPTTDALLIDDPIDGIDDPSTNNRSLRNPPPPRKVRRGGSARQPNRNKKTVKTLPHFVQIAATEFGPDNNPHSLAMGIATTKNNALVVFVQMTKVLITGNTHNPVTVSDSLGNIYIQAGSYVNQFLDSSDADVEISVWYCISGSSGANTLLVTPTGSGDLAGAFMDVAFIEYAGVAVSGTLDGVNSSAAPNSAGNTSETTGTISVSTPRDIVVGAFTTNATVTADGPFIQRADTGGIVVADLIGANSATAITGTAGAVNTWVGIGLSLHPAP